MFYGQCNKCGERWGLGTEPTCVCPAVGIGDISEILAEREGCITAINGIERKGEWITREEAIEAIKARSKP